MRQTSAGDVVINEIAWMGTAASSSDEWIELYNTTDSPINVAQWSIFGADTENCLNFADADGHTSTMIPARGYLLYANDTNVVNDADRQNVADIWDATIGLHNSDPGQVILYDAPDCADGAGRDVDSVGQADTGWFAGDSGARATMERIAPDEAGTDAANWKTHTSSYRTGYDADGNPINGTPKALNAASRSPTPTSTVSTTPTMGASSTPTPASPTATVTHTPTTTHTPSGTPTTAATPTATPTSVPMRSLIINEVAWMGTSASPQDEWIELRNTTSHAIDLDGWRLQSGDGSPDITLDGVIPAGEYFLLERTGDDTISTHVADLIYTGSLGNGGESLTLLSPAGTVVDTANGDGGAWPAGVASAGAPAYASMERIDPGAPDADANWASNDGMVRTGRDVDGNPINGTPKQLNSATLLLTATPTPSPSATASSTPTVPPTLAATSTSTASPTPSSTPMPSATATPTIMPTPTHSPTTRATSTPTGTATPFPTGVRINEVLPAPSDVDWDGDGSADYLDEWIELYNAGDTAVTLRGWVLDDEDGGSRPHAITDTVIAPDAFVVFYRRDTGIALNNDGDDVRLIAPDGTLMDTMTFDALDSDASYSRDETGTWHDGWPPSPGRRNAPPSPTATPTHTPTPGPPAPLLISEVVYDGTQPGDSDEFVELYNPSDVAISIAGWGIGDAHESGAGEGFYRFPDGLSVSGGGTVVIARDAAGFYRRFERWPAFEFNPQTDTPAVPNLDRDTRWGSGNWVLNNTGDEVILVDSYDRMIDAVAFRHGAFEDLGLTGHDISAPAPRSIQRVAAHHSLNLNDVFVYDSPTPGDIVTMPTPPPTPPPAPDFGGLFAFWGTLHAHTTYSDGSGPPDFAYATARANGLHFLTLSDHSHWYTSEEWGKTLDAARAATIPGTFIAMRAFEWTSREQGHINVFESDEYLSRETPAGDSLAEFYQWLQDRPQLVAQFNHPFPGHFDGFSLHSSVRDQLPLIEAANGGGEPLRFADAYWQALQNGWRVGAAGNLDTQTPDWGEDGTLRTGLLATALTDTALMEAVRERRAFSTEDATLALALRAGDVWMGGEIDAGPAQLSLLVADRDREPLTLELWRAGAPFFRTSTTPNAAPQEEIVVVRAKPGDIFVARAVQEDGQEAWSSPLWVRGDWTPPPLYVNEILPAPRTIDWNGDGTSTGDDEWIELYNPNDYTVGLTGWTLDDEPDGSRPYRFPLGTAIPPGGYMVLYKSETGVSLNDAGDVARLIAPDGTVVSQIPYEHADNEQSISRDSEGNLHRDWRITPGEKNRPPRAGDDEATVQEPADAGSQIPFLSILELRQRRPRRVVTTQGWVTVPPNVLGAGIFYIQDARAGLKVYYRGGELPALEPGDIVRVTGVLDTFHNELELRPWFDDDVVVLRSGSPPAPQEIAGSLTEEHEGRLVRVTGTVAGWQYNRWWLETGRGTVEIYLRRSTGLQRPWLERGERQTIVGVATTWDQGRRILPAVPEHLTGGVPLLLPPTGGQ